MFDVNLSNGVRKIFPARLVTFGTMSDILYECLVWVSLSFICLPHFVVVPSGTFPCTSFVSLASLCLSFLVFNILISCGKIFYMTVVLLLECSHAEVPNIIPPHKMESERRFCKPTASVDHIFSISLSD